MSDSGKNSLFAKTLYISDLDGTLLNSERELSEYTVGVLNRLIADGIQFSVATARSAATVIPILKRVPVPVPVVLMNGTLIYDLHAKSYVNIEWINRPALEQIWKIIKRTGLSGLMYGLAGDELRTYYERLDTEHIRYFVNERTRRYKKKFIEINDFAQVDTDIIYFCFLSTKENIEKLDREIKEVDGIRREMYQDIYKENYWYLEVFSDHASKYNAVMFLRKRYSFDKVVGFGDNTNDIPLFKACDESYAVANAIPEAQKKATAVIGSHLEDGVAKWMEQAVARDSI